MRGIDLRRLQEALAGHLEEFVRETGVRLAVLINRSGQVLAQHGFERRLDLVGVASLAAGIHASSRALARQVGEDRFEHLYHAGETRRLFIGQFETPAGGMILVAVFDRGSSIGLVRLFFEEFTDRVGRVREFDGGRSNVNAKQFEKDLEASLDRFFQDLVSG